jgi:ferrochelatase
MKKMAVSPQEAGLLSSETGVLITNLGTPEAPTRKAVRKFLAQFLSDPSILQIPRPIRWLLLNGIILTIRASQSAKLYQKIWTPQGSPLLVYSLALLQKLQTIAAEAGYCFSFALGMRYGKPSIQQALMDLYAKKVTTLVIFPLYPQYSTTTTASTFREIEKQLIKMNWNPNIKYIENYATEESYLKAISNTIHAHWQKQSPGHKLLFSFHGLPQRSLSQGDPYFHQCHQTAEKIAELLPLDKEKWEVVFQSRFGRERWLQPYCSQVLEQLAKNGCKQVDIICPGFAVDCLETLEEIAITNKRLFQQAGGLNYNYIPALNDSMMHAKSLAHILIKHVLS